MSPTPSGLASSADEYSLLKLSPIAIKPWEDGLRTDPSQSGVWEWWYFDAHLDNGAKLVVAFFTKDFAKPNGGLDPRITLQLDTPEGKHWDVKRIFSPDEFFASKEHCDVHMTCNGGKNDNFFSGDDLRNYKISGRIQNIEINIQLASTTQPWRPATGHILYGKDQKQFFAWLPSVPHGAVTATYRVDGEKAVSVMGHGYHDHNWGNVSLASVVNNWYWGRGTVGPYTFISSAICGEQKYGNKEELIFMLQRDGKIIADDQSNVVFTTGDIEVDPETHRPIADKIEFKYEDGTTKYVLKYSREKTILRMHLIDSFKGLQWLLARLVGFDGCYLRFSGKLQFAKYDDGILMEEFYDEALWELMWFGRVQKHSLM